MTKVVYKILSIILLITICIGFFNIIAFADESVPLEDNIDVVIQVDEKQLEPEPELELELEPDLELELKSQPSSELVLELEEPKQEQKEEELVTKIELEKKIEDEPEPKSTESESPAPSEPPKLTSFVATVVFNYRNRQGEWASSETSNTLSPGSGWTITAKKADNVVANYKTIQVGTVKYTFTGWDTSFPIKFANLTEDTTIVVTAQYAVEGLPNLTTVYTDNVAHGSSSWSSNDSFTSYTHTFKTPADIPAHYEFLYWEGNGATFTDGGTFSISAADLAEDTTINFVAVYKYQPSVQVNYHYLDNVVSILDYNNIDIYANAPIENKWFYNGGTEPIPEGSVATLPESIITTTPMNEVKIVDVYAKYFTVTWVNADGTILEKDESILYGAMPEYNGGTPTKQATADYIYRFKGWTPKLSVVTEDVIYIATFNAIYIEDYEPPVTYYTITFLPGTHGLFEPKSVSLTYGSTMPSAPATAGEEGYKFTGWSPAIDDYVTGNAIFTAQWEKTETIIPLTTPEPNEEEVIRVKIVEDVEDKEIPLAARPVWALMNLILLIVTIFTLVKFKKKYNVVTPIAVLCALGLFIFTENVHNPMVIFDQWTVWQLLICIVGVGSRLIAKEEEREEQKQEEI